MNLPNMKRHFIFRALHPQAQRQLTFLPLSTMEGTATSQMRQDMGSSVHKSGFGDTAAAHERPYEINSLWKSLPDAVLARVRAAYLTGISTKVDLHVCDLTGTAGEFSTSVLSWSQLCDRNHNP
jgi:hypothetical protein